MSYIIVARVDTACEENYGGDPNKVVARILDKSDGYIKFDIRGDHFKRKELTKKMCDTLINAGFVSFEIYHSY